MHHQLAGSSGNRRQDRGEGQLHLRAGHRRAIGRNRGIEGRRIRRQLLELFARRDAPLRQVAIALGLRLRICRLREIALEIRFGLRERRLEGPLIQTEEQLAFRDLVTILEVDRGELAGHLGPDGNR